ncbi:MAG: SDR family NAD(P)-dependent oxidoreductase, partial [Alphaproteobacteria bacterium]|nr:SDR family NAD(P)-dependent oxidoreductase [Alphaproteobacteria bacterium]
MYRARPADGCVWITGASSGIGRGVALELARRGYNVIASARRADQLNALSIEAKGLSGRIFAEPCDITHRDEIQALVERINQTHGPIALAFLNAGT